MKNYKSFLAFLVIGVFSVTSCKKEFFDINKNPNDPETADLQFVFPNAVQYTGYVMGNYFQIWGGLWSQYWTQGPTASQYESWDAYIQTSNEMDRPWSQLYAGALSDFDYVQSNATAQGRPNYAACAMIMKAYVYQVLTDAYGDIPFSDALKGAGSLTPKFDAQQDVYKGITNLLQQAIKQINYQTDEHPGAEDMLFHGDMHEWLKFANTLKLRVMLRQAYAAGANVAAKDTVAAMFLRGDEFLDADVRLDYDGSQNFKNPLNSQISFLGDYNLIGSATSIDTLLSMNDPRIDAWYKPASTGSLAGQHNGLTQGAGKDFNVTPSTTHTNYSLPGNAVGGGQNQAAGAVAPIFLMSATESYFLQAEAYARGWAAGSDGMAEYDMAVEASFLQWGFSSGDAVTYLADPRAMYPTAGNMAQKIEAIITQKWFALNSSQAFEAWTEFRRTGYPDFLKTSVSSSNGAGVFPNRFTLPSDEITRNPNAAAINKNIFDKVWWDQN